MDNYAYQPDDNGKPFAITRYSSVRPNNDYLVEVNSRSKLFKSPKFYKSLAIVLALLAILLLILVIVFAALYCTEYYQNHLCNSEECLRSAANLHLSIDFSVDPCEDFYQYTCGRWSKEHPNHGWFPSFSSFTTISERILIEVEDFLKSEPQETEPKAIKQVRNFYQSCLDSDAKDELGFSVIFKYLKEVELPPVPSILTKTDNELVNFKFDWLKYDAVVKKTFGMDVLIGFGVEANLFNRSENVMYLGTPSQTCPLPSPLRRFGQIAKEMDYSELRKVANANIMKYVILSLYKNSTSEEPKSDTLQSAIDVLLNITFTVEELVSNYTDVVFEDIHFMTIKEHETKLNEILTNNINKDYPEIWQKYLGYLFDGTNVTVDFEKDLVYLSDNDDAYLPRVVSYLLSTSDVYLELYMWWVTVFAMILNTNSETLDYISKQTAPFYTGMTILRTRSLDCSVLINSFMGMAVGYGLADRTFSNKTKPKVEQMLYDIKDAFVEHVNSLTWMDKETKRATLEKSKEMISFIGYPDWLLDKGALDVYYEGIVLQNDTYLENMMTFVKAYLPSKLEDLRKVNERNWTSDPVVVNAYNSFSDNSIIIPMGILSHPVYNLGLEVLNYGAIGSILGHELTHGFDNTGRKYDKFGNYKEWWTNETLQTFEEKISCFVKQYDNFTIEGVPNHVQGLKTLGENIADNGGLNHAYRAYRNYLKNHSIEPKLPGFEDFTHDQLFFIAFGNVWCQSITLDDISNDIETDAHSPNRIRVIGTLQNSEEFAHAFKCSLGSKMNPDNNKCKVW